MNHEWEMMQYHDAYVCVKCGETAYRIISDNGCYPYGWGRPDVDEEILRQLGHGLQEDV